MSFNDRYFEQIANYNTKKDKRSNNAKTKRLLSSLAVVLKDLPHNQQKQIDHVINDLRDGVRFNWIGSVEVYRNLLV
ncbi:hypothetical protein LCGC14_0573940 [marine sediment metagenome]|uniref:Uncharacterized protein n=1 Tax=marine sediment metagenome TaxID=412755 RepID=A0A0F9RND9_9ZZZZ